MNSLPVKTKQSYPLTVNDVKVHLRISSDNNQDDAYILSLIKAATQECENFIEKDIAKTKNVLTIDNEYVSNVIRINEGNLISVESVKDNLNNTLAITETKIYYNYFTIELTSGTSSDDTIVTYYTGYNANECPEVIKQAILMKVADYYDMTRGTFIYNNVKDSGVFERMLNSYKIIMY